LSPTFTSEMGLRPFSVWTKVSAVKLLQPNHFLSNLASLLEPIPPTQPSKADIATLNQSTHAKLLPSTSICQAISIPPPTAHPTKKFKNNPDGSTLLIGHCKRRCTGWCLGSHVQSGLGPSSGPFVDRSLRPQNGLSPYLGRRSRRQSQTAGTRGWYP